MPRPATRWAVVLVLAVGVGACGGDTATTDAFVGTWTGTHAEEPVTLVVASDGTFTLTLYDEVIYDEIVEETGAWRREGTHRVLATTDVAPHPHPRGEAPDDSADNGDYRIRRDKNALVLERRACALLGEGLDDWIRVAHLSPGGA